MDVEKGVLAVDFETASAADLKKVGQWAYSLHDSTRVYCAVFGYAEEPGVYSFSEWGPGAELPEPVVDYLFAGGRLVAHNAAFEKAIWANILLPNFDFPFVELGQWRDTQVLGLSCNLPMSLDGLAHALGCPVQKDKEGAALMRKMAKLVELESGVYEPIDKRSGENFDTPENRRRLLAYCRDDVGATLDCYFRLPPLPVHEELVRKADDSINDRGIYLDLRFTAACLDLVKKRKRALDDEVAVLSGLELANARDPHALKRFLHARNVEIPKRTRKTAKGFRKTESTDAASVLEMLEDLELDPEARVVLENRAESTKATSLAKLDRVAHMIGRDGRLRYALQYQGAHTGRWTSGGLQVHNLPKNKLGPLAEPIRKAILAGDLETIEFLDDRPLAAISASLRSVIAAPPGREIIAADYSAIEARVIAWLAGQGDILVRFMKGEDVYVYAAKRVGSDDRQLGKVCTLGLGYGMGVVTFVTTAAGWGVRLELKEARRIQRAWREVNEAIVAFWKELEDAFKKAIAERGRVFYAGGGKLRLKATEHCLFLRLPSGRVLRYWKPRVVIVEKKIKIVDEAGRIIEKVRTGPEIRFSTMSKDKGSMSSESTYGGKLAENVTQAIARDLLAAATVRVERTPPYDVIVHVHDSLAAEVPRGRGSVEEFCQLLEEPLPWAKGLPLEAEGYRDVRFRG